MVNNKELITIFGSYFRTRNQMKYFHKNSLRKCQKEKEL